MKFKIFDYDNQVRWIEDDTRSVADIQAIFVNVISGDETGIVLFKDNKTLEFDASNNRFESYNDGMYLVTSDKVQEWIDYDPDVPVFELKSHERLLKFI